MMKSLYRSRKNRKISGVLGGFAQYFGIDATLLRVIFAVIFIFTGFFPLLLVYLACVYLMPEDDGVIDHD